MIFAKLYILTSMPHSQRKGRINRTYLDVYTPSRGKKITFYIHVVLYLEQFSLPPVLNNTYLLKRLWETKSRVSRKVIDRPLYINQHREKYSPFKNVTYSKSIKLAQMLLKIIACQKSHCMIVYLKYYDSGCKYIWTYMICSNSYKPSIKMLNCSSTMPLVLFSIIANFLSLKVFKIF